MRAVVQRVAWARVSVEGAMVGAIDGPGLCVLVGVRRGDFAAAARKLASKLWGLRIFDGAVSVADVGGRVLVVSQFTLYGDVSRGRRPSWIAAAPPSRLLSDLDTTRRVGRMTSKRQPGEIAMRRLLLCASLLIGLLAAPSPAEAHTDVCTGVGIMSLAAGFGLVGVHPPRTTAFSVTLATGGCAGGAFTAGGRITGWCNAAYGYGATPENPTTAADDHNFAFTVTGMGQITGDLTGSLWMWDDFADVGSCANATATRFLVYVHAMKSHNNPMTTQWLEDFCNTTTTWC